ncbi:hypothetical protein [Moritella sp. F3]|uniref:hypothetical protein n=1 Tax=Moritella sp. F3 TaxID=2718882 RepID=UPI0018E119F1|nr:hypothetical protein [Moritella sp. F3]GIC77625.1 hypothetical protein FMO001_23520 [Moritella sp. F1]GIC82038.1 hypothetical protein FMO003_23190 [Moritella sp. F3]
MVLNNFKPFELMFEVGSPIILGRHPIHLDGLLSNLCYKHTGCPQEALTMLKELLTWDGEHQIYHASAMAFGVHAEQGISATTRNYVGNMKSGKQLRDDLIAPTKVTKQGVSSYRKLQILGGPERNRLNKHAAYHSPYVIFHGVGDITKIEALVRFYCTRLGVNANSGSGTIKSFSIRAIETDLSLIDGTGTHARNMPVALLKQKTGQVLVGTKMPVAAPYWRGHDNYTETMAIAVPRVRRLLVNDF